MSRSFDFGSEVGISENVPHKALQSTPEMLYLRVYLKAVYFEKPPSSDTFEKPRFRVRVLGFRVLGLRGLGAWG